MRTYVHRDWLTQSDYTSGLQTLFDHANLKTVLCVILQRNKHLTPLVLHSLICRLLLSHAISTKTQSE